MKRVFGLLVVAAMAAPASAQIVVDGTKDAAYGAARAGQLLETSFGDAQSPGFFGSELDGGYAKLYGGRLYILLTGNLEGNFNKLEVFIDSKSGGENQLNGVVAYDFGNQAQSLGGLTFDSAFTADYHAFARHGGGANFDLTFVDRAAGLAGNPAQPPGSGDVFPKTGGSVAANSTSAWTNGGPTANPNGILEAAFDNSNTAGVGGNQGNGANAAAALAVSTGLEFSVSLLDLGIDINTADPNSVIRIAAMVNSGDHTFLSNQVLNSLPVANAGSLPAGTHLGTPNGVNFNNYAGDQFFTIALSEHMVPEPASAALVGLAALGLAALGRKRFA